MAGTYKTSGRERLLSFLSSHPDTPYTVDELAAALQDSSSPSARRSGKAPAHIGKSSLYRQLAELVDEGRVRRDREAGDPHEVSPHAAAVYRYVARPDCARHFHLQCLSCGTLLHLDCTLTTELLSHIESDHHFLVHMGKSVLYGICESCAKGQGNGENERGEENEENGEDA